MLKNEFDVHPGLPDLWQVLTDLGYLGLLADCDVRAQSVPHRKPRRSKKNPNTALMAIQRTDNQAHASQRVKVEHAISRAKRLGCVTQMYCNKSAAFNNRIMVVACGIWNWHLTKKTKTI